MVGKPRGALALSTQIPKNVLKIRTYLSRSIQDPTLSSMPDEPLESGWFYATVPRSGGLPAFLSFGRGSLEKTTQSRIGTLLRWGHDLTHAIMFLVLYAYAALPPWSPTQFPDTSHHTRAPPGPPPRLRRCMH